MSKEHAMGFPFIGSTVLLSLFLLFKFLPKDLINAILTEYFFVLGILALGATVRPLIDSYLPKGWHESTISCIYLTSKMLKWSLPNHSLSQEFQEHSFVYGMPSRSTGWQITLLAWLSLYRVMKYCHLGLSKLTQYYWNFCGISSLIRCFSWKGKSLLH